MLCPKCENDMETLEYEGVEVDRCMSCKGIWFDVGESDSLRSKDAAAIIDTGDPSVGRQTNEIVRYRCPRCEGGMMRMVDPQRAHIWYEECTSCRGSFFDAGEFSDLTDDDVADFLKLVAMSKNQYWCVAGVPAGTLRSVVVRAKLQLIQTNQSPAYWCCEDFCNVSTIRARFTRQCSINRYSLTGH